MTSQTLQIERTFQAPASAVFDAWTSEEVMRRWFHAEHTWQTPVTEVDLRLGGAVRVVMRDPDQDVEHGGGGHYTEIDPPHRLAFTWTWDDDDRETLIELDFEEVDGTTTVRLTHSGLRDLQGVRSHEGAGATAWTTSGGCWWRIQGAQLQLERTDAVRIGSGTAAEVGSPTST